MHSRWARPWFAVTAALVVVELVITCINAADTTDGHFHSAAARVFNVFWYVDRRLPDHAAADVRTA